MKKILKHIWFRFRNIITLRPIRKWIMRKIELPKLQRIVQLVESQYDGRAVLIFQYKMFDIYGKECFNGGAERYVVDLADILAARGYRPILIQMGNPDGELWHRDIKNLRIFGLPTNNYVLTSALFKKYEFVIYSGATEWGKKLHPNIMISHGITWDTQSDNIYPHAILKLFDGVDKLVSVDTNTISWLRTTFAKTMQDFNAVYVPNYVDTKLYKPIARKPDGKIHITFPRRAAPERGYWLMSDALPPIMEKYKNVVFNFIGFAHGDKIKNDINRLIKLFPGRVNHRIVEPDDMPQVYQEADISLIPTLYSEGTSLSCLEAQSTGNIVISTNVGGLPNLIIDGYNGILINPNAHDLMTALDMVLANAQLRKTLSQNAVSVARAFDKSVWEQRWGKIIDEAKGN